MCERCAEIRAAGFDGVCSDCQWGTGVDAQKQGMVVGATAAIERLRNMIEEWTQGGDQDDNG